MFIEAEGTEAVLQRRLRENDSVTVPMHAALSLDYVCDSHTSFQFNCGDKLRDA